VRLTIASAQVCEAQNPLTKSQIYLAGEPFQPRKLEVKGFSTRATKLLSQFKTHVEGELFPLKGHCHFPKSSQMYAACGA